MYIEYFICMCYFYGSEAYAVLSGTCYYLFLAAGENYLCIKLFYSSCAAFYNFKRSIIASEGINKAILRQAVVMQMTWPGAPTLYYGDETGLCGWTDPDNRRSFPWGREDWDLIDFYKYAISIHKQHPALLTGSLIPLLTAKNLLSYGRCLRHDRIVVVINTATEEQTANVDTKPLGIAGDANFWRLMITTESTYNVGLKLIETKDAQLTLPMPPLSAVILWEK